MSNEKKKKEVSIPEHSVNTLLNEIQSNEIITEEMVDELEEDELRPLIGFKITKIKVDGDHRHDGQMVDYIFTFKSPSGKITTIFTEMCLMVGFNVCQDIKFKL